MNKLLKANILNSKTIAPLSPIPYILNILVPEIATRLIQDDFNVEYIDALRILEESKAYGQSVHTNINIQEGDSDSDDD